MINYLFVFLAFMSSAHAFSSACEPGTYQNGEDCFSCMAGTYASATNSTACDLCGPGQFANQSGAVGCDACSSGTFQYASGSSDCLPCRPGTFQSDQGMTACLDCPVGQAQAQAGSSACSPCLAGSFAWAAGSAECEPCGVGSYQPFDQATLCTVCDAGKSQPYPGSATCSECLPGTHQPKFGQSACVSCGRGEFQSLEGSTVCVACPPGTVQEITGQWAEDACLACPTGTFKPSTGWDEQGCTACPPGSFSALDAASACTSCIPGEYQANDQATACLPCPSGTFSSENASAACEPCPAGTYGPQVGASSSQACLPCQPGNFSSSPGQTSADICMPCPLGTFQQGEDHGACALCPEQAYCPDGLPIPCGPGLVCNGTYLDAGPGLLPVFNETFAWTIACPHGTLCAQKLASGDKGLLPPWPQQVHFIALASGEFRRVSWPFARPADQEEDALFWLLPEGCSEGWFLLDDTCTPCPNGTFSSQGGALDASVCEACPAGSFGPTQGSTACLACTPGTSGAVAGMSECSPCLPGSFQDFPGGLACRPCAPGTYMLDIGASACRVCQAGTFQPEFGAATGCEPCHAGSYSSDGDSACLTCGVQPNASHLSCASMQAPFASALWISVQGQQQDDGCLASPPRSTLRRVKTHRLYGGALCKHTLRVLGAPGLDSVWQEEPADSLPILAAVRLTVVPYNDTFYPLLCRQGEGFGVLYALHDQEGGPVESQQRAVMHILDPSGANVLFHAPCSNTSFACHSPAFCPTMDVKVRVSIPSLGLEDSVVLSMGRSGQCPPVPGWTLSVELQQAAAPFFPQQKLRVAIRMLNPPEQGAMAFRLSLRILSGFVFASYEPAMPSKHDLQQNGRFLLVQGDASQAGGSLLGMLVLDSTQTAVPGVAKALRMTEGRFVSHTGWLAVPVRTEGFASCRSDGFLDVLLDQPRPTSLLAHAVGRQTLVHWRAIQDDARVFPVAITVLAVWNTRRVPTPLSNARCISLTEDVLAVTPTCSAVTPVGAGEGAVLVSHLRLSTTVRFHVLVPTDVAARFLPDDTGRRGRVQILAWLFDTVLDIAPVLALQTSTQGVVLRAGDELACQPGFEGEFTLGEPVIYRGVCPPAGAGVSELFLLAGAWTKRGGYRLATQHAQPSFGIVGPTHPLISEDSVRAVVVGDRVSVLPGATPRCVPLTDGVSRWSVPMVPPSPLNLSVRMSSTVLVVQQDMWQLIPNTARLVSANITFSDGQTVDVTDDPRLVWNVSGGLLVKLEDLAVRALTQAGQAQIRFTYRGMPCLSALASIRIHVSSVLSATLECLACPSRLTSRDDPLSQEWPLEFRSSVLASAFVVRHVLADNTTRDTREALQVTGMGVLEDGLVQALRQGEVCVSTAFTRAPFCILAYDRWAVWWDVLCNGVPCTSAIKLAPAGDGAGLPPFSYATHLSLSILLKLANGTSRLFHRLPQMSVSPSDGEMRLTPGELNVSVELSGAWGLPPIALAPLQVVTLDALQFQDMPPVLYQVHCARVWEQAPLHVLASLSDGTEALVNASFMSSGPLRVEAGNVQASRVGSGMVRAQFARARALTRVAISLQSKLYTDFRLPRPLPAQWDGPLNDVWPVQAELVPALLPAAPVQDKVLRWTFSQPGVVAFSGGRLRLLSDYPGVLVVTAYLTACQDAETVVQSVSMRVNLSPSRHGQADFGAENGPPLPNTRVGDVLAVPVYLLALSGPLVAYRANLSLPGLADLACAPGEQPFSACLVHQDGFVSVSGDFPESQRTGRIHVGTLSGRVQYDAFSRLRVSLSNATYEFAVRLGRPSRQPAMSWLNTVQNSASLPPWVLPAWPARPASLQACCDVVVASPLSPLARLLPAKFGLSSISAVFPDNSTAPLDLLADPRLQLEYDDLVLRYQDGQWLVDPYAQGTTVVTVWYLSSLSASIQVTFAQASGVRLSQDRLDLLRIHCGPMFQQKSLTAKLVLVGGAAVDLDQQDTAIAEEGPVRLAPGLAIAGEAVGEGRVTVRAFGFDATARIVVHNHSVHLTELGLPDPYELVGPRDSWHDAALTGRLETGERLTDLAFLQPTLAASGPVTPDGTRLALQGNSLEPGLLEAWVSACETAPALSAGAQLTARLVANLTAVQPADVEASLQDNNFSVVLAGIPGTASFLLTLQTDAEHLLAYDPGPDLPSVSDCVLNWPVPGSLVLAGVFQNTGPSLALLLTGLQPMPRTLSGTVETFSPLGVVRSAIVAGQYGPVQALPTLMSGLPVVDSGTLARQRAQGEDTSFTLALLTGRQRLVDARLYSNEFEFSAMFRVTDRFLEPDNSSASIRVMLSPAMDGWPAMAEHVVDGWYALQFPGQIPRVTLGVSFELTTSTSGQAYTTLVEASFQAGKTLHECPRVATDRASFLVVYHLFETPPDGLVHRVACLVHVSPRRVALEGPDAQGVRVLTVAVESFIRIQQAHQAIMDAPLFFALDDTNASSARRLFSSQNEIIKRVGLQYINDTADPPVDCPPGMYFSAVNGTYRHLPLHSLAGPDCYGMACAEGYTLLVDQQQCVPSAVSLDLVWVCIIIILALIALVSCTLCLLYMGRLKDSNAGAAECQPVDFNDARSWSLDEPFPSELPHADDQQEFKNILIGSCLDDYARTLLDDDFALEPVSSKA